MQKYTATDYGGPHIAEIDIAPLPEAFPCVFYLASDVDVLLNPRLWDKAQHEAWHRALPDVQAAFEALRNSL